MQSKSIIALAVFALGAGGVYYYQNAAQPAKLATPPAQGGRPPVSVLTSVAVKKPLPVRIDAVGTVQPIAQVNIRPRVDSQLIKLHVADGANVKAGDMLITLDGRQLEAQIRQAEGQVSKDKATLEGAKRDFARANELFNSNSASKKAVDDTKTKQDELLSTIKAGEGNIDNLKVQLSYTEIRAPITGRMGTFPLKPGSIVRQGEVGMSLGTLIQTSPIYVAFGVPQRRLAEIKAGFEKNQAIVEVQQIGSEKIVKGNLSVIDNTVDVTTGNVILRATFANTDEALWAGSLVNVRLSLGSDESITVPSTAVQIGQQGTYVFVVKDNVARVRPMQSGRTLDNETVVDKGVEAGEMVVTDGQIALVNGAPVAIRNAARPASSPANPPPAPPKTGG